MDCDSQSAMFVEKTMHTKYKTYWCALSLYERHAGKLLSVAGEGKHYEENCKPIDQVCEHWKFSLV